MIRKDLLQAVLITLTFDLYVNINTGYFIFQLMTTSI